MYSQGKIMRRLLGRHSADSSPSTTNDAATGVTSSPTAPLTYRPYASQTAVHPIGDPIASIDRSPDGRLALLGGRHILQTVHLDGIQFKKGVDVRAAINKQPPGKASAAASVADQYSIKDAKLSIPSTGGEPTIFTACANGKIFMYDIGRLGSATGPDFIQAREDSRQVNKLDFNPHRGNWLLAGGQDGVVRCFDVKSPVSGRAGPTFRTFQSFRCNAEGIRDVKWSPKDGMIFACGTESGFLLKWDIRKSNMPLLKINAHDTQKGVTSISWHPDGDHLITAGLDSKCHVWDLSKNAEKRQKPKWTITTPAPVAAASWRPALWSATAQGKRAAQVAVSYDESGNTKRHGINSVHIWDLARPSMPFKEINIFERCPSSLLWHDQDLLWTVGQDGLFVQCDVAFAPKVLDRQPLSNLSFSSKGEVLMLLEERSRPTRPRPPVIPQEKGGPTSSYSSSPTGPMLSISRSDSEEDVMASFLAPKRRGQHRRKATSTRPISTQPMSTTPPSGSNLDENPISLDQVLKLTGTFKPQQVMAIGHVPAACKGDVYEFMAGQYLEILQNDLPVTQAGPPLNVRITKVLEQYARAAETMSQFRLAQTWRILSYAMSLLLTRRSQYHLEVRTTGNAKKKSYSPASDQRSERRNSSVRPEGSSVGDNSGEAAMRKASVVSTESRLSSTNKSLLSEELESESNVATPLARPMVEGGAQNDPTGTRRLTPVMEMGSFKLPPAMHALTSSPRKRLDSTPYSVISEESQLSSVEGYDFYDVDTVRHDLPEAIDVPKKKEPLSLDYVDPKSSNPRRRPINRHDSDESFGQMFSVSDGSRQASMLASSSGGSSNKLRQMIQDASNSQDAYEVDYGSRIRGHKIGDSPERNFKRPALRPMKEGSSSSREDYMVSQTTIDTLDTSDASFPVRSLRPSSPPSTRRISDDRPGMDRPEDHRSPSITETDFLPWTNDPPYPYPLLSDPSRLSKHAPPIDPYDLIQRALSHESRHSALHASAMILLLKPLVPEAVIDSYQATAILRSHHNRLMRMKCFVEAAMLRNLCVQDWPQGIDMWGESYTAVFLPAQEKVSVGYTCSSCHKAREVDKSQGKDGLNGNGIWKCERCKAAMAPCAVCGHRAVTAGLSAKITVAEGLYGIAEKGDKKDDPMKQLESGGGQGKELGVELEVAEGEETGLSTWWYCPGCAHGGHAACLMQWHAITDPASESATQLAHEVRSLMLQSQHHHHHHAPHASHGHTHSYSSAGNYGHQHYNRIGDFGPGSRPGSRPASRPSSRPNSRPASPVLSFEDGDRLHPEMFSDGCCPADGCGHACLPGRWRNETLSARTEELGRVVREQTRSTMSGSAGGSGAGMAMPGFNKSSDGIGERRISGSGGVDSSLGARPASLGSASDGMSSALGGGNAGENMRNNVYRVRGDTVDYVPQSRAVESVREALNRPGGGGGSSGSGHGGSSVGTSGGGGNLGTPNMGTGAILSSSPSGIVGGVLRNSSSSISAAGGGGAASGTGERERRKSVKFAGAAARGVVSDSIRGQGGPLSGHQEEEAVDADGSSAW